MDRGVPTPQRRRVGAHRIIGAALLAVIILGLGAIGPFSRDDFLSLERIGDVAQQGHWLVIHDTYPELHYLMAHDAFGAVSRKPPLFYWLCALAVRATGGITELNARVVSLLAALALALVVLLWSAARLGTAAGWLAFAFLLGSYGFAARATVVLPDMLLTFFVFSFFCLIDPLMEAEQETPDIEYRAKTVKDVTPIGVIPRSQPIRTFAAGVLLGLAILTKGPLALVLCALAGFIYHLLNGHSPWASLRRLWPWTILITALSISAWWYAAEFITVGGSALALLGVENVGSFLPPGLGGEGSGSRGFFYIELKVLVETMPLSLLLPASCLSLIMRGKVDRARSPLMLQLSLILAIALFFSLASMKRDDYILPALPPLAILLAGVFAEYPSSNNRWWPLLSAARNAAIVVAAIGSLFFIACAIVLTQWPGAVGFELQATDVWYANLLATGMRQLSIPFVVFLSGLALAELVIFSSFFRRSALGMGTGLALLSIVLVSLWTGVLRPELNRRRSLKLFALEIFRQQDHPPVFYLEYPPREIAFYAGRYIPQLPHHRAWCGAPDRTIEIIIWQREAATLSHKCLTRLKPAMIADYASADRPGLFELEAARGEPAKSGGRAGKEVK